MNIFQINQTLYAFYFAILLKLEFRSDKHKNAWAIKQNDKFNSTTELKL